MTKLEGKQWVADVDLSIWRKKKNVDNMRRAFISFVTCGESPPEDLLQAVAVWFLKHPKKLPVFEFKEADFRYSRIKKTMETRGEGVTREDVYKIYAKEWGQEWESVKTTFLRWESGELPVNLIETS